MARPPDAIRYRAPSMLAVRRGRKPRLHGQEILRMSDVPPLLRHVLATLAYRASRVVLEVPDGFSEVSAGGGGNSAGRILAHVGDVLDWAESMARGDEVWVSQPATTWEADAARMYAALGRLDARLAEGRAPACPAERLLQGPLADALTHIGQLAMLRRVAGAPVTGENFFVADVAAGRVGTDQSAPVFPLPSKD